jgi:hypothetical protein
MSKIIHTMTKMDRLSLHATQCHKPRVLVMLRSTSRNSIITRHGLYSVPKMVRFSVTVNTNFHFSPVPWSLGLAPYSIFLSSAYYCVIGSSLAVSLDAGAHCCYD